MYLISWRIQFLSNDEYFFASQSEEIFVLWKSKIINFNSLISRDSKTQHVY